LNGIVSSLHDVALSLQQITLHLREVPLHLREVPLRLREVPLRLREVPLRLREVPLHLRENGVTEFGIRVTRMSYEEKQPSGTRGEKRCGTVQPRHRGVTHVLNLKRYRCLEPVPGGFLKAEED
jgi:hypothetical protein